ncbi:unnamed protein product [Echinostoma caproni]|uniref:G_PROTEIN_RECEP_F1_2 domain-containing protein n=1 Tax=Echinostoma caproni TaxID=27848 RepID=A0A183A5F6_9TREM|nr:unnamed protein product [Echinostoma caproni]
MNVVMEWNETETHQQKSNISLGLYASIPPIFMIVGIPGNLVSMYIWSRRMPMTPGSTSLFLVAMCITDTYVLTHGCLRLWLLGLSKQLIDVRIRLGCRIPLLLFTFTTDLSSWIIILLCVERVISTRFPIRFKSICHLRNGLIALIGLVVCLMGINAHFLWTVQRKNNECVPVNAFSNFMYSWQFIDASIYSFIPLACILALNTCIIIRLRRTAKCVRTGNRVDKGTVKLHSVDIRGGFGVRAREQRSARLLRTVLCMVICHFTFTMPIVIYYLFDAHFCESQDEKSVYLHCDIVETVTTLLQLANHVTHFFIYSFTSTVFLSDLKKLIPQKCCLHKPHAGNRDRMPNEGTWNENQFGHIVTGNTAIDSSVNNNRSMR